MKDIPNFHMPTGNGFTLADAWDLCPFRSLIGRPGVGYATAEAMAERVGASVALIEETSSRIAADMMADIQEALAAGRTVLLLGSTWASPPSKPMIDRDGQVMKDGNYKIRYQPIIEFKTKETRTRFSQAVITALRAAHPEALP